MTPNISSSGNKSDDLDALAEFISFEENEYGSGMDNIAISYLNREKSKQGKCAFFDPYYVNGNVSKLNTELAGQSNRRLLTAPINVYGDSFLAPGQAYEDLFENTLKAIHQCHKSFDTIVIPIGCQEAGTAGHNICVVLENQPGASEECKATILDQMGDGYYKKTKLKILDSLFDAGISDVDYNRCPLSYNRNDCATVVSYLGDLALQDYDMRDFKDSSDLYLRQTQRARIPTEVIDEQHGKDQNTLLEAANKLAGELIRETYRGANLDSLRGIEDIPTTDEIVSTRIKKFMAARSGIDITQNAYRSR